MSAAEYVVIETMPEHVRGSHRAAGNWGVYPHNGAERHVVERAEADEIVAADEDGYDHIVDGADVGEYPGLPVKIYRRMDDGRWLWSDDGRIDAGRIIDCTADLDVDVYDALDDSIDGVGSYTVTVDGCEYRADVGA